MITETERINITIQKDLAEELKKLTSARKRSAFINEAIRLFIERKKQAELDVRLEEGYKARSKEGLKLTNEFEAVDLENWDEY